jgi:hypothetical protein
VRGSTPEGLLVLVTPLQSHNACGRTNQRAMGTACLKTKTSNLLSNCIAIYGDNSPITREAKALQQLVYLRGGMSAAVLFMVKAVSRIEFALDMQFARSAGPRPAHRSQECQRRFHECPPRSQLTVLCFCITGHKCQGITDPAGPSHDFLKMVFDISEMATGTQGLLREKKEPQQRIKQ